MNYCVGIPGGDSVSEAGEARKRFRTRALVAIATPVVIKGSRSESLSPSIEDRLMGDEAKTTGPKRFNQTTESNKK